MCIDGKWYTEPEIVSFVHKLKNKIAELEHKVKENIDEKNHDIINDAVNKT